MFEVPESSKDAEHQLVNFRGNEVEVRLPSAAISDESIEKQLAAYRQIAFIVAVAEEKAKSPAQLCIEEKTPATGDSQ